jgi:hypothetical protein
MSGMRWKSEMHERALQAIGKSCCGPDNGIWDPDRRYWVCDYHDGFNDGLNLCEEMAGTPSTEEER